MKKYSKGEFIEAESWQGKEKPQMKFYGMTHLNLYLTGKLHWNANENVDEILGEYFKLFYGAAADEMRLFWSLAEKTWMKKLDITGKGFSGFLRNIALKDSLYDKESLGRLNELLQKASKKTQEDSIYHKRIELIYSEMIGG